MAARCYELTEAQWERIKVIIPRTETVKLPKDDRLMLNTKFWLARSGTGRHSGPVWPTSDRVQSILKVA